MGFNLKSEPRHCSQGTIACKYIPRSGFARTIRSVVSSSHVEELKLKGSLFADDHSIVQHSFVLQKKSGYRQEIIDQLIQTTGFI